MSPTNGRDTHMDIIVRDSTEADMASIQQIYTYHVLNSLGTFEEKPPTVDDLSERRTSVLKQGLPYLTAELDGKVVGYSYANAYRPRPAYRYTIEDSVYVTNELKGRGIGRALLSNLIKQCENGPWRQMIAVIGDSSNAESIALHRSLGFHQVGVLHAVGFKFGNWVDTVIMQRELEGKNRYTAN